MREKKQDAEVLIMTELRTIRERFGRLLWAEAVPLTDGNDKADHDNAHASGMHEAMPLKNSKADRLIGLLIPGDREDTLCWSDLDYDVQNNAFWPCFAHVNRIRDILSTFGPERMKDDPEYASVIRRTLNFWLAHEFWSTNWWFNDIGVPMTLGDIALMIYEALDKEMIRLIADRVRFGSAAHKPEMLETGPVTTQLRGYWTGANLIWGTMNTIRHALLTEDEDLLRKAVWRTGEEITVGMREGIQSDGSFFQHGPRLYSGGYGMAFANSISKLTYLLQGTSFQLSREKLDIFLTHILDGLYHMTHCGALDNACVGREITRPDVIAGKGIQKDIRRMANTSDMPRQEDIARFLSAASGGEQPDRTKFFPCAMYLCHHFDGLHVGAKYLNNQTWDAEICNGENPLAFNMSYGTHTCVMRDGSEYLNINPVWDFSRIPGTTARTETDEQLLTHVEWWCLPLPNDHSGGGQEGSRAIVYELAQHDGVEALAAAFAFEHGCVFLGCGVKCTERPEALVTTVEQCMLKGEIRAAVKSGGASVLHNGIRYTALNGTDMKAERALRRGSWKRNSLLAEDIPVEADVFTLTIRHPAEGESAYAYMISAEACSEPAVRVLRNDEGVQAIQLPDGGVMAVFHRADALEWDGKRAERGAGVYIGL